MMKAYSFIAFDKLHVINEKDSNIVFRIKMMATIENEGGVFSFENTVEPPSTGHLLSGRSPSIKRLLPPSDIHDESCPISAYRGFNKP